MIRMYTQLIAVDAAKVQDQLLAIVKHKVIQSLTSVSHRGAKMS